MVAERERWLDSLKGFAILLVVLGHVLSGYLDAGTFPEAYDGFHTVRTWIYSFHMPLFFLLSGYTFTLAYWKTGRLDRRRYGWQLLNLVWIYVEFALIQWAVKQAVPELVNETYDLDTLKRMLVEPLGNFWYIYVLVLLYLLGAATGTPRWPAQWLLLPAGLAAVAADMHLDWTNLTLYRVIYHFFFFAAGCALCRRKWLLKSDKLLGLCAMYLSVAAFFYFFRGARNWYANWQVIIALGASLVLTQLFYRWEPLWNAGLLQLCGRYCLELYLLHTFFTAGLRTLLPDLGLRGPWANTAVNFIVSTGACLALAWLAGKCRWADLLFRPARFLRRLRDNHTNGREPIGTG